MTTANYVYLTDVLMRPSLDDVVWCVSKDCARTFGDFSRAVNGWKLAFEAAGVKRAALYFTDVFDSGAALFGAIAAGVVAVLPADTTPTTCKRLADGAVDACAGDFSDDCGIRRIEPVATKEPCRKPIDENAKLIELFTSGSTGEPSIIVKRLRQLFVEVDSIEKRQSDAGIDARALMLSTVSQQHIYGLLFYLLWPLASGRKVWHTRITAPEEVVSLAASVPCCAWVSSPAHLKRLPEHLNWAVARKSMQAVFSSGGPLADEGLKRTIELTELSPLEFLGSSESGGIAIRQRGVADDGTITRTEWHRLPAVEWKCEDGLLVIKSPQLATDGWEVTPDRIEPIVEGESFYHLGRADRIAKIEEKRVSMTAVEKALEASDKVATAKTLQLADARTTFAAVALLSPAGVKKLKTDGKAALVKELKDLLAQSFERVCLPRKWRFVSALPENSMGKTTVAALQALFDDMALQYVVENRTPDSAVLLVTIPGRCPYFEGHFPEFALLPGVAQIEMTIKLAREFFALPSVFTGIKNLKFMQPVLPNSTVCVALAWNADKAELDFGWQDQSGNMCAKGKIMLSNKEGE